MGTDITFDMVDTLSKSQRSYCMSRVPNKDTSLEREVRSALHREGLRFFKHCRNLPGSPDIVFPKIKVAVFIDGDFWHGYRFPTWKDSLPQYWQEKISRNRKRDQSNFRKLRRSGWRVIRVWGHEVKKDIDSVLFKIHEAVIYD